MQMIYADPRRIGTHGIGRFTRYVLSGINYCPIALTTNPNSPYDPVRLALVLRKLAPGDLFFSPGYNPPLDCPAPFIYTLHDLNHIDRPENSSPIKRLYYAAFVKRACRLASRVLTVSEFSRRRIIEWSGVSPDKVLNVGSGVGPEFNPDVAPYRMPFRYVLCVGNRKGHKNELRQVEAFARAQIARDIHIVLTGEPTVEIVQCAARYGASERVHFLGQVPDEDLPSLYRGAAVLLFASLYEGFGLPLVEAMACGTPVITSNITSLPEIAGEGALLVKPTCVSNIGDALERLLVDNALREQLRAAGLLQASQFTWERTAAQVRSAITDVLAENRD
jgi:glycosyltransferase involved in cell wall biosynthesis